MIYVFPSSTPFNPPPHLPSCLRALFDNHLLAVRLSLKSPSSPVNMIFISEGRMLVGPRSLSVTYRWITCGSPRSTLLTAINWGEPTIKLANIDSLSKEHPEAAINFSIRYLHYTWESSSSTLLWTEH